MNVQGINDVRQREIHTAEPLEPEPSASEFDWFLVSARHLISHGRKTVPGSRHPGSSGVGEYYAALLAGPAAL